MGAGDGAWEETDAMRLLALLATLLVMLVGAQACSGDPVLPVADPAEAGGPAPEADAAATPGDASAPLDATARGAMTAFCNATYGMLHDGYDACCSAGDKTTLRYQLVFGQLAVFKDACAPQLEASVAAGRVVLDPAAHAACTGAFAKFFAGGVCGKDLSPVLDMETVPGCDAVVAGQQDAGRPCLRDYECRSGLTCVGFTGPTEGTCQSPPAIGAACGAAKPDGGAADAVVAFGFGDHPTCASGATCNRSTRRCAASANSGEPCSASEQCAQGLRCLLGACSSDAPSAMGGPCKANKDCAGTTLFCQAGDAGTLGHCATKSAAGTPCLPAGPVGGSACLGQCATTSPDAGAETKCASFCGSG